MQDIDAFRGSRLLRNTTARHALTVHREGRNAGAPLLRAAELDGTLIGSYLAWPKNARPPTARLADPGWLLGTAGLEAVTIVFAVYVERTIHFVVCQQAKESVVLEWSADDLEAVRGEVSAVTKRGNPRGDPLARSPRWLAFAAALGRAVEPYLAESGHLLFLFGTGLDNLPLHLLPVTQGLLLDVVPCSYAASLLQVAGLFERRRQAPARTAVRPAGIVSVPRGHELPKAAAAFSAGADTWRRLLEESGQVPPRVLAAGRATPEAVLKLFGEIDLLLLSCHGLASPGRRVHSLLLASDGQQPPSLMRAASDDLDSIGSKFLLPWDAIRAPAPGVVLSAACSSASATVAESGERISLDRALCVSDTLTFIGPLWDVSVADAHTFIAEVLQNSLRHGMTWTDSWRRAVTECRVAMPPATWQSFVLIGDWT